MSIKFDLFCDWHTTEPVYRIYVDQELLTERSYLWDNRDSHVRENVEVEVEPGIHRLDIVNLNPEFGTFRTDNIEIDGEPADSLEFRVS